MSALDAWVGRTRRQRDTLGVFPARAMAALLDEPPDGLAVGASLSPGWHWLYFNRAVRRSGLGSDGHERRGGFLPPVPLPRRMWAGGRLRFGAPLSLGDDVTRTSTVLAVEEKEGGRGPLVIVTVEHRIENGLGGSVVEEQDLVYLGKRGSGDAVVRGPDAPEGAHAVGGFRTDPVTLFHFSALTYNGHRIHYDHPYATETEGYPGLVVHGPLLALLLLRAATSVRGTGAAAGNPTSFSYRAMSPVFCGEEILISTGEADGPDGHAGGAAGAARPARASAFWAATAARGVAMTATAEWR